MYKCLCGLSYNKIYYFQSHQNICSEIIQEKYIQQFEKTNFDDIEFINGVPKVVFVCWFGGYKVDYQKMPKYRFEAFKSLVENIGVPVILITSKNYTNFIKQNHPIHPSFNLLSGNHKSDYIRAYLLHYYGGGYHDIKHRKESWKDCWGDWLFDNNIWIFGRRENTRRAIGYPPNESYICKNYYKLVTMGWVICKPNTKFTQILLQKIEDVLTKKYFELELYPGINSGGYYHENPFQMAEENNYPLRWLEIMGEISHPLMLEFISNIKYELPDAIKKKRYS
jgi:hypothetical protein